MPPTHPLPCLCWMSFSHGYVIYMGSVCPTSKFISHFPLSTWVEKEKPVSLCFKVLFSDAFYFILCIWSCQVQHLLQLLKQ